MSAKKKRPTSTIDIGDAAEDEVRLWATKASFVVNSAQRDKGGWDHRFEIRRDHRVARSLDQLPADVVCDVQVKATRSMGKKSIPIKLSNWERHVKSPIPVFFLVLSYDQNDDVERAYLVHVDRPWVEKVLRRLRREGSDGTPLDGLHKKTLSLKWDEEHRIEPSPIGLREGILGHVPDSQAYPVMKCEWISTVGYERDKYQGTLSFAPGVSAEDLADLAIGLRKDLPLHLFRTEEVRFGIKANAFERSGDIAISFPDLPSVGEALVAIRNKKDGRESSFRAKTLASFATFPGLPESSYKMRFLNDRISIVVARGIASFDVNLGSDEQSEINLREAAAVASFIDILSSSESDDIELELSVQGSQPFIASAGPRSGELENGFRSIATTIRQAWDIARDAGGGDDVVARLGELGAMRRQVALLWAARHRDLATVSIAYDEELVQKDRVAFVASSAFALGSSVVAGIVVTRGVATIHDEPRRVVIEGEMSIRGLWIVAKRDWDRWRKSVLDLCAKGVVTDLEENGYFVCLAG